MRPYQTLCVLEDLAAKQTGHLQRKGVELSLRDNQTAKDVIVQWTLLMVDLGYLSLVSQKSVAARIFRDLVRNDIYDTITAFTDCVDAVRYQRSDGFEALLDSVSPHLKTVFRDSFQSMLTGNVREAKRLIQAFSYMGRLTLLDIDLQDQCLQDYMATEESIKETFPEQLIGSLRKIIERWLREFDSSDLVFRHGPGGVAGLGRTTLERKYKSLFRDELIDRVFGHSYYAGNSGITSAPDRISQTIFVPKSYKAFRTISMEPAALMYLQQGLWRELDRVVSSSPYLSKRIGFHDQDRNQLLARIGSVTRGYATIDLSAASDSVSWELVRRLFGDTSLFPYLVATRSTHTLLPDGRLIELKKFAPMGSAMCFPIETMIFAAICEHSCQKVGRVKGQMFTGDYSVFGDDIIIPSGVVKDLEWSLDALGFTVNSSKSFTNPNDWFRESCGGEFCDGFDVTPLRVSRRYKSENDNVSFAGSVDLSNSCFERGYECLRLFFIRKLLTPLAVAEEEKTPLKDVEFIPHFAPGSLVAWNYTNFHTKTRFSRNLQRNEVFATSISSKTRRGDDELALRHWLETTERRETPIEVAFEANIGRVNLTHQNRFVSSRGIEDPTVERFESKNLLLLKLRRWKGKSSPIGQ